MTSHIPDPVAAAARMIAVCHNSGHCAWRPGPGTAHGTGRSRQQHRRRPSVCSVTCCGHVVDHALRSGEICLVIVAPHWWGARVQHGNHSLCDFGPGEDGGGRGHVAEVILH